MRTAPWSNEKLKKLGKCIAREELPPDSLPSYDDVMTFFNDVAADTQQIIADIDWEPLLGGRKYEVTSRPKTIDTLRQKLQRDPSTGLQNIQDVAGVRFEAEMTLTEQDAVVAAIVEAFQPQSDNCVRDLRERPHSGYRAVHIWLRLPVRVEIQVRTHLQGEWPNMYESLADVIGRDIRYGVYPEDAAQKTLVEAIQQLSIEGTTLVEKGLEELRQQNKKIQDLREASIGVDFHSRPRAERRKLKSTISKLTALETTLSSLMEQVSTQEASLRSTLGEYREAFDSMRKDRRN